TENNNYSEEYLLFKNQTDLIENFSILFRFDVQIPEPAANITIFDISPQNNSLFGNFDILPEEIIIPYLGDIDFANSQIQLKYNGTVVNSYNLILTNSSFKLNLTELPEGLYEGFYSLQDQDGRILEYYHRFEVFTGKPPRPISIYPAKGRYSDEVYDFRVTMESGNYTVSYLVHDGFPALGASGWTPLSYSNGDYNIHDFDFEKAGIGAIYVRITDIFGNIVIYPTGIISAPSINIDIDQDSKTVEAGDEISIDVSVSLKKDSGTLLRCRMTDFIANEDDDDEVSWRIKTNGRIEFDDDDDEYIDLYNDFDETLEIKEGITSKDLELSLNIPISTIPEEDYESTLECIIV
ncbi:MAG: hypothetical protein DRP08_04160, partial [Candidatus Aenigmatarchaeota archaeon]